MTPNLKPAETVYTPEREAIMRAEWAKGTGTREIWEMLCALPGKKPAHYKAVKDRASVMGLQRPADFKKIIAARRQHSLGMWTPERMALLRELSPDPNLTYDAIAVRLNMLPGSRPVTGRGCERKAQRNGIRRPAGMAWVNRRTHKAAPPPKQPPHRRRIFLEEPPAAASFAPMSLEARLEKAAKMLAGKGRDYNLMSIVGHTGLEPWQVAMVAGRVAMGLPIR